VLRAAPNCLGSWPNSGPASWSLPSRRRPSPCWGPSRATVTAPSSGSPASPPSSCPAPSSAPTASPRHSPSSVSCSVPPPP